MGVVSYYLAISLDGYLAREDSSVDWLNPYQTKLTSPYDYEEYYKTVAQVIMGRNTWEVATSFEARPYQDRKTLVCSGTLNSSSLPDYVKLVPRLSQSLLKSLRAETQGRIWLVGGAQLAAQALAWDCLDEIILTIAPVTLGSGIPWLGKHSLSTSWELKESYPCERGLMQLVYQKRA